MKHSQKYDHFYLYSEIEEIIKGYLREYPSFTRLESIGVTAEGRNIWAVSVTDTANGGFEEKPAYCVNANIHAGEVTGSMCAMYLLDVLYSNMDDPEIKKLFQDAADSAMKNKQELMRFL